MPFGLWNAGQSFQRFMDEVLEGLDYCFVYGDDVLIWSKSLEEHEQHLREVLSRMAEHGIVLNGEKLVLGVPEVQFLGHIVSACGIIPLPEKVAAIRAFPWPGTIGQLMSYLGMVNFYRRFIKGAAGALKPLTDALCGASGKAAKLDLHPCWRLLRAARSRWCRPHTWHIRARRPDWHCLSTPLAPT